MKTIQTYTLLFLLFSFLSVKCQDDQYGTIENSYRGGLKAYLKVKSQIVYPEELKKAEISGHVYFRICIDTQGAVKEINFLEFPDIQMKDEVERVIMLTTGEWIPKLIENKKTNFFINDWVYFELR